MDQDTPSPYNPCPLPTSSIYEIRQTPTSGRAVFATIAIPEDALIHRTSAATTEDNNSAGWPDPSPLAWVIQRPYRKECCAECFAYNRGREWKVKVPDRDCGVVFCSQPCLNAWIVRNGEVGVQAWENFEAEVKAMSKRKINNERKDTETPQDINHKDENTTDDNKGPNPRPSTTTAPTGLEIQEAWETTTLIHQVLQTTLTTPNPTKTQRKVLRNVAEQGGDPDLMYYHLTAIIQSYNTATRNQPSPPPASLNSPPLPSPLLPTLYTLHPTSTPYPTHSHLHTHTSSHLSLLTLLPPPLRPHHLISLNLALYSVTPQNAFSLRPTNTDGSDTGEYLGQALYPTASFFNHSCEPNVKKRRTGRDWEFWAAREVKVGEELGISYLGGEEGELGVKERRRRLCEEWGFWCGCGRCVEEESKEGKKEGIDGRGEI